MKAWEGAGHGGRGQVSEELGSWRSIRAKGRSGKGSWLPFAVLSELSAPQHLFLGLSQLRGSLMLPFLVL